MKKGFTYIMSNYKRSAIYIGSTSDLERRVLEHRYLRGAAFTWKYKCNILLYYETHNTIAAAIDREKQLKNWRREWKYNLIKEQNPEMKDLSEGWYSTQDLLIFKKFNNIG